MIWGFLIFFTITGKFGFFDSIEFIVMFLLMNNMNFILCLGVSMDSALCYQLEDSDLFHLFFLRFPPCHTCIIDVTKLLEM